MKQIALTTAYLTVLSTLAFAQLPNSSSTTNDKSSSIRTDTYEPTLLAPQPDEFVPFNNYPFFPGGRQAIETYLHQLDMYPQLARETMTEGTVRLRFRVLPDGNLNDIQVIKSRGHLLDQAAIQAVASMPRWYPAHRSGTAVSCPAELSITFLLD